MWVNSVYVSGNDVYVTLGSNVEFVHGALGALFKNGVQQNLGSEYDDSGVYSGDTYSVFVSGNDVYVAGSCFWEGWGDSAALWRNGVPHRLPSVPGRYTEARSVFVSGGDVYVAGYGLGGDAMLWKNGVPQHLSEGDYDYRANSVFVSGNDVYVAGRDWNRSYAVIWVNGTEYVLGKEAQAESVFVK